jgi:hypothetical protein
MEEWIRGKDIGSAFVWAIDILAMVLEEVDLKWWWFWTGDLRWVLINELVEFENGSRLERYEMRDVKRRQRWQDGNE